MCIDMWQRYRVVIPDEVETLPMDQVVLKSHVGGLVKSFERKAAA